MDSAEAAQFDSLLERSPISVARRLTLSEYLYHPPKWESLSSSMLELSPEERERVFYEIAPLVKASHRGDKERQVYFELAASVSLPSEKAESILAQT